MISDADIERVAQAAASPPWDRVSDSTRDMFRSEARQYLTVAIDLGIVTLPASPSELPEATKPTTPAN